MSDGVLLLIDGHSVAYRAFFGLPVENFQTATGQPTNAVYGFTAMLINLLATEQPTHIAVAFDVSRRTFRTEEYEEYKGTRAATPPEFVGQVDLVKEVLDAMGIVHLEVGGFEADDIIATLARTMPTDVLICTGDRDTLQLVNDRVTVLYPRKGVSDLIRLTPDAVAEKYLVPPARYPELAALVGETSDNLPGVPGVGPKTAAKWLTEYDGLENLLRHAEDVPGKVGESLRAHLDDVQRNRRLNALVSDMDLGVTLDDLQRRPIDREAVHALFDTLQFRTLRDRLLDTLAKDPAPKGGFAVDGTVLAAGGVSGWLDAHAQGVTGLDVVGSWRAGTGDVLGIALASSDGSACWIDTAGLSPADDAALAAWLADEHASKVMHDAKGPLEALWARGWELHGLRSDTQLAAYLLRPDQRSYDLADLVVRHLGRELAVEGSGQSAESAQAAFAFGMDDDGHDAMVRSRAVIDLASALDAELETHGGAQLLRDVELPLERTLARMEATGIAVDADELERLRAEFDQAVAAAQADAFAVVGHPVNLGSPKQLQTVLFDELGMPKTRRTQTGYTTDADALEALYVRTEHPFLAHLLRHRDQIRLRQSVDGLIKAIAPDGRIHTTFVQTAAGTGRLSSQDPNLQNIPVRTAAGRRIRGAFVVGNAYEALMTTDYSQIEMRIMAHASGDQELIDAFASGEDFHSRMAARVFGTQTDAVTPEQRARIKAMNYGLAYGLSAFGLSQQLHIEVSEARALMDEYFERFGHVREYLTSIVAQARKTGYTETILGRRRYLPDLTSSNRQRREMAERAALNAPIQGSAADIIKIAMLDVDAALAAGNLKSRMLLQVHDELILEIAPGEREAVEALVREKMGHAVDLAVPLDVSIGVGRSWQDAAH